MPDTTEEARKKKFNELKESIEKKLDKIERDNNLSQKFVKTFRKALENIEKSLDGGAFAYQMALAYSNVDNAEDLEKTVDEGIKKFGELKKLFDELNASEVEKFEKSKNKFGELNDKFKEIFDEISENCGSGNLELKNVDYFINRINTLKKDFNNELEELEGLEKQFDASKSRVNEKLKKLKDSKKLKEKTYDAYETKVADISKIYDRNSKFKMKTAVAEMSDLDKILEGELKRLSSGMESFDSLEELSEEEIKKNETKENKVKNYVKSKIGNARYFEKKVVDYSKLYKGKDEFMPLEEMREIYGSKGALMMICRLEDGSLGKKKRFSTYRKFCKKILEGYRSLKVEAAITALEGKKVDTSGFSEEKTNELNDLLHELNELQGLDTSKIKLADSKNKNFSFSKFFSGIKSQITKLKSTKGAKIQEHKNLINKIVKEIRKVEGELAGDPNIIEEPIGKDKYVKKYNDFVEKSAKLAVTYLKSEGKKKIERFSKNKEEYTMDACKVALMCLVAVCSKNKKYITEGKSYFKNVKSYLSEVIG